MSFEKYCHGGGDTEGWMEQNDILLTPIRFCLNKTTAIRPAEKPRPFAPPKRAKPETGLGPDVK